MSFGVIVLVLLGISEALALIPGVAENSVFQLILSVLKKLAKTAGGLFSKKEEASDDQETTKAE